MIFPKTKGFKKELENGLDVIFHEDHAHPLVSLQIWVETGSMHELPYPGAGLSHLLEHMVFKGTKSYSGDVLANRVEELGGSWNAYTTYDRTVYYLDGPSTAAKELLHMLFELVYLPSLPEQDLEMEKEVIRKEISMGMDDPNSVGWEELMKTAYQTDSRRFPIIGYRERFDAITHEEMVNYHEGRYTFDNSFIVISGDVNSEELLKGLAEHALQVPPRRLQEVALPTETALSVDVIAQKEFPIPICKSTRMWHIPKAGHPDFLPLETLASVIGGARSSSLYQNLREGNGLALNLSAWCWHPKNKSGMFAISTEALPEKHEPLSEAILEEIRVLDFSAMEEALKRVKKQAVVSQISTLRTVEGRAKDLGSNWFETRNLDFTRLYLEQVQKVTVADLERVANKYLRDTPTASFSLVPEGLSSEKETLNDAGKEKILPELSYLKNGLPLIIGRDANLPTISFQLIFKGGNTIHTEELEGIGALHSILLGKGTQKRNAEEFVSLLDGIGASLSMSHGNNTFIVSGFCLEEDIQALCELATEALTEPLFDEAQMIKEKDLLLAKIKESSQDPLRLAFWHCRRNLLQGSPYRLSQLGSLESIEAISKNDLVKYHKTLIEHNEATLAVFGEVKGAHLDLLENTFGKLSYNKVTAKLPMPQFGAGRIDVELEKEQAVVVISYPGASIGSEDTSSLELIQDYLSSMAGPLFTELREEKGLAYYVSCNQFFGVNTGMFSFYIGTSPERKEEAVEELQFLIAKIVGRGISQDELERVKAGLVTQNAKQDQSHSSQARTHGINVLFGKDLNYRNEERERMKNLTIKEVSDCLKKYFSDALPLITVVSTNPNNVQ